MAKVPLPLILLLYVVGYVLLDWASYIHPVPSLPSRPGTRSPR
jgi:hypothetical protein